MKPERNSNFIILLLISGLISACSQKNGEITIAADVEIPQIAFAVEEVTAALLADGIEVQWLKREMLMWCFLFNLKARL